MSLLSESYTNGTEVFKKAIITAILIIHYLFFYYILLKLWSSKIVGAKMCNFRSFKFMPVPYVVLLSLSIPGVSPYLPHSTVHPPSNHSLPQVHTFLHLAGNHHHSHISLDTLHNPLQHPGQNKWQGNHWSRH